MANKQKDSAKRNPFVFFRNHFPYFLRKPLIIIEYSTEMKRTKIAQNTTLIEQYFGIYCHNICDYCSNIELCIRILITILNNIGEK